MSSSSRVMNRVLRGEAGGRVSEILDLKAPDAAGPERSLLADPLAVERAAAYRKGYDTALAEVSADEQAAKAARAEQLARALVEGAARAREMRDAAVSQAARQAVELAFELTEVLLAREVTLQGSLTADSLRRALALVPQGEDLVVRLHPDDAMTAEEVQELVHDASVKVVADPEVEEGGCVVEAGPCRIDAQIGPAIARARALIDSVTCEGVRGS